ncbi:hypothetical protein N9H39_08995 [Gammaproteobacteria bacterium]|nr:hypothetical protein [Gammaproteobacteria bacterium]
MFRAALFSVTTYLLAATSVQEGEMIYTCQQNGGGVLINNEPFEPGECESVIEKSVDTEVNLLSADEQIPGSGDDATATGNPNLLSPNPLIMGPDFEASTMAVEAAGAAGQGAEATAQAAANLVANPYDAAQAAEPFAEAARDAAFDAADAADVASQGAEVSNNASPGLGPIG